MYNKRHFKVVIGAMIVLSFIIMGSLVYAAFTGQLNIRGTATARQSNWDVHFENLSNVTTTGSAKVLSQPALESPTSIEDYDVTVTSPGDTISFTVDVVNEGNYNASITSVSVSTPSCSGTDSTSNSNVCSHLHYSLTYDTGATVQVGDTLYAKETNKMKVTLNYDDTVTASELPTEEVSISNLGITINFEQSSDALVKENGEVADYKVYHQGEKITLNNEDYYVIENSGADKDYVVALKENPLTVAEVNNYGASIPVTAVNRNGYGMMVFGTNELYVTSDIKVVVDAWSLDKFQNDELKEINNYVVRLITTDEYSTISSNNNWRYNSGYEYWTMTPNYSARMWKVGSNGNLYDSSSSERFVVRPVINVYKSALETNNNNNNNNNE